MSGRLLPNFLTGYMEYTKHSEAPDAFHFWTGVSTIAGALRRRVWIDQRYFQWVPNFYIIFVAPPGIVQKSTTANIGMKLLKQLPRDRNIHFGPDSATWQALIEEMGRCSDLFETNGKFMRMSAITIVAGELGTFLNPSDTEQVDALVSLWDGQLGEWRKATKTMGTDSLVNPWINLIGCTTPTWITRTFPDYMIGGGFTSRAVFVYAEEKRRLVAYPGRDDTQFDPELEQRLVHDLTMIADMKGPMYLTNDAYTLGEKWYAEFHGSIPPHLQTETFGGYVARKQTHIHKLAMVLSAAESSVLSVEKHHLEQAIAIVTSLEHDMPRIFEKIGQDLQAKKTGTIRELLFAHGEISIESLWRMCMHTMGHQDFKNAVTGLVASGICQKVVRPEGTLLRAIGGPVKSKPEESDIA